MQIQFPTIVTIVFLSSCYAKILEEINFHAWEIPGSGSKAEDGEKERRAKVGDNNGLATQGARKHAWRTQAARRPPQSAVSGRLSCRHICKNPDLAGTF